MEMIIIAGKPVVVPPEVVSAGRLAVQAWHCQQLTTAGIAFTLADNGDPRVDAAPAARTSARSPARTPTEE